MTVFSERVQNFKMQENPLNQFCRDFHVHTNCRGPYFYGILIMPFDSGFTVDILSAIQQYTACSLRK